ncbi:hypothetical protein ACEPPN_000840 [Leptodophora sp. 'Broadleaf-Isolate-01']
MNNESPGESGPPSSLSTHSPTPASVHSPTPELAAATSNPGTAVQVEQVADKKAVEEEAKSKLLRAAREKEVADLRAAIEVSRKTRQSLQEQKLALNIKEESRKKELAELVEANREMAVYLETGMAHNVRRLSKLKPIFEDRRVAKLVNTAQALLKEDESHK